MSPGKFCPAFFWGWGNPFGISPQFAPSHGRRSGRGAFACLEKFFPLPSHPPTRFAFRVPLKISRLVSARSRRPWVSALRLRACRLLRSKIRPPFRENDANAYKRGSRRRHSVSESELRCPRTTSFSFPLSYKFTSSSPK